MTAAAVVLGLTFDPTARIDTSQVAYGAAPAGRGWGAVVQLALVLVLAGVAPMCVRFLVELVRDVLGGER